MKNKIYFFVLAFLFVVLAAGIGSAAERSLDNKLMKDLYTGVSKSDTKDLNITITCDSSSIIGDANGNGIVNSVDALYVLYVTVGLVSPPSNICCMDANGSGFINATDALMIAKYFVGQGGTANTGFLCSQVSSKKLDFVRR